MMNKTRWLFVSEAIYYLVFFAIIVVPDVFGPFKLWAVLALAAATLTLYALALKSGFAARLPWYWWFIANLVSIIAFVAFSLVRGPREMTNDDVLLLVHLIAVTGAFSRFSRAAHQKN